MLEKLLFRVHVFPFALFLCINYSNSQFYNAWGYWFYWEQVCILIAVYLRYNSKIINWISHLRDVCYWCWLVLSSLCLSYLPKYWRWPSIPTISIFTRSNRYHSFMVKRVMSHFAKATIVKLLTEWSSRGNYNIRLATES